MYYVDSYELDGVNIDFEYISKDIIDDYLQFLRELSVECRKIRLYCQLIIMHHQSGVVILTGTATEIS